MTTTGKRLLISSIISYFIINTLIIWLFPQVSGLKKAFVSIALMALLTALIEKFYNKIKPIKDKDYTSMDERFLNIRNYAALITLIVLLAVLAALTFIFDPHANSSAYLAVRLTILGSIAIYFITYSILWNRY